MEKRIATVELPSSRGHWGASHTSDRFQLFSNISLIYQMQIDIKFFEIILRSWILDGVFLGNEGRRLSEDLPAPESPVPLSRGPAFFSLQVTDLL